MTPRQRVLVGPIAAALLLVPLVFAREVYDFTRWPRLIVLQTCILAALIGHLALREKVVRRTSLDLPVLAFIAWSALSIAWATNAIEGMLHLNTLVTMGVFYFLVSRADARLLDTVVPVSAVAGVLVAAVGIGQYLGFDPLSVPTAGHPGSTFGYRNYVATYLALLVPVVGAAAVTEHRPARSALYSATAGLAALLLLYTRTRGAWAGLAGAALVAAAVLALRPELRSRISMSRAKLAILGATVAVVLAAAPIQDRMVRQGAFGFDERKADLTTTAAQVFDPSGSRGRLGMWQNTLRMFADHPVFGVGLGGWMIEFPVYDQGAWITWNVAPQRPHNDFLWVLSETGLIGFGLYAWIVWYLLRGTFRAPDLQRLALAAGGLAYLGHSFFSFPRERIAATMMFWLVLGVLARATASPDRSTMRPAMIAGLMSIFGAIGLTYQAIAFDKHFARAANAWNREDWHSVSSESRLALDHGVLNFRALQLLGLGEERTGRLDEADAAFTRSFDYHPNEGHLPWAQVKEKKGDLEAARRGYLAELRLYPKSTAASEGLARTAAALGDRARQSGEHDTAADLYRESLRYNESAALYNRLGELAMRGDVLQATAAFQRASELAPGEPRHANNLGAALRSQGNREGARDAFLIAISRDSTYARAHRNLGDLLLEMRDTIGAISAYEAFLVHWNGNAVFRTRTIEQLRELKHE